MVYHGVCIQVRERESRRVFGGWGVGGKGDYYYSKSWPKKIIAGTPHRNALVAAETKEVWLWH